MIKIPDKKFHFPSAEVMLLHTEQITDKSNNAVRFATVSRKKKSFFSIEQQPLVSQGLLINQTSP